MERNQLLSIAILGPQLFVGTCLLLWRRRTAFTQADAVQAWAGSGSDAALLILLCLSILFILPEFIFPFFREEWAPTLCDFFGSFALAAFTAISVNRGYFSVRIAFAARKMSPPKAIAAGALRHLRAMPIVFLASVFWTQLIGALCAIGIPLSTQRQDILVGMGDAKPAAIIVASAGAILLAPIGEELLFRDIIHRHLKSRMGSGRAAIYGSLAFALLHGNLCALFPLFTLGMLLIRTYEREGNILPCIAMHALFNGNGIAMELLSAL
ncbi:MAG: CPBP family intramembrane metalloprotease [Puniceicoccales bacterium]|jgi:membrane protease YdiL (CAAX protease family)|nr:CPBP family intramembrane metalloprotease [Puniceicoccales bacterium]